MVRAVRTLNPAALFNPQPSGRGRGRSRSGGRGRRDTVESNPSPTTWLLIFGGAALLGGLGIAAIAKGRDKVPGGGVVPGNGGTVPGGGGGGGTVPGGGVQASDCAGGPGYTGGYGSFANQRGVALALQELGYNVGQIGAANYNIYSPAGMNGIIEFQEDFNVARKAFPDVQIGALGVDGCAGPKTITAIKEAKNWQLLVGGGDWQAVVQMGADVS